MSQNTLNHVKPGGSISQFGGKVTVGPSELPVIGGATLSKAAGAANVVAVSGQLTDYAGNAIAGVRHLRVYMSDSAVGAGISDYSPSTAAPAISPGSLVATHTASLVFDIVTDVNGAFTFTYTDTAKENFTLCVVLPDGRISAISVVAGDYGA